jgi:hypothetical protein
MRRGLQRRARRFCENPLGLSRIYLTSLLNHAVSWSPRQSKAMSLILNHETLSRDKPAASRGATTYPTPSARILYFLTAMSLQNIPYHLLLSIAQHLDLADIYAL